MNTYYLTTKSLINNNIFDEELICTFDISKYIKIWDILDKTSYFPRRIIVDIKRES